VPGALQDRAPFAVVGNTLQTFNSNHFLTNDSAYDVSGELNSSFMDKKLLLDVRLGWHHQIDEGAPGDGQGFDNIHNLKTLAGIPSLAPLYVSNVLDFEDQVPASVREACGTGDRTTKCQTTWASTVETTSSSGKSSIPSRGRRPSRICSPRLAIM
jgi:hypothetical protein